MSHECTIGGISKIIVNDTPNRNIITNQIDIEVGKQVETDFDESVQEINATIFPE